MAGNTDPLLEIRRTLVAVAHRAYARGLTLGVSGNLSVRLPGRDLVLIKATGKSLGDVTEDDLVLLDLSGDPVDSGGPAPSKERLFHVAIYRRRADVGAVVHLHPPHAVAYAVGHAIPPFLSGAARSFLSGSTVLVPPAPSGSPELAQLVQEAFANVAVHSAVLAEHGTVTVGPDVWTAFYRSEYLEDAARVAWLAGFLPGVRDWQ